MAVRRDYFNGKKAEDIYEMFDLWREMKQAGYSREDYIDTSGELICIYEFASVYGGYDLDFSDYKHKAKNHENWRRSVCYELALNYLGGFSPGFSDYLRETLNANSPCFISVDVINERIAYSDFVEACVNGGVIEMLDAWLSGVPVEQIVTDDSLEGLYIIRVTQGFH